MAVNERRCLSCRRVAPKDAFWRIVRVHPTHAVSLTGGMGRSAYLCPNADCLRLAQRKNRLGRSLKAPIPPTIYDQLWQRLALPVAPIPSPDRPTPSPQD
jgi:predicted RNA-binding protein YlxR (DUF448 family)